MADGSHLLGGVPAQPVEGDGEAGAGGCQQPQSRLGLSGADSVADEPVVVVEAVESVGELPYPGGDLVGCAFFGGEGDDFVKLGQAAQHLKFAFGAERAEVDLV